jgi:uncharacterized membrane protein
LLTPGSRPLRAARRYYTPWQICVATLIGGPLAGGFFASRDHVLFGAKQKATPTLLVSTAIVVAGAVLGSRIQPNASETVDAGGTVVQALIALAYRWYAVGAFTEEISKRQSEGWTPQSWWHVVRISFAFLLGFLLIVFTAMQISTLTH